MGPNYRGGGASFPTALGRIHLNPDGDPNGAGGGGGDQGQGAGQPNGASSAPVTQPNSQGAPQNQGQATNNPTTFAATAGAGQSPEPNAVGAGGWTSVRDALQSRYGFALPENVQNDEAALDFLFQNARQNDYYAQLGRQLAPRADELRTFLQGSQGQGQPQQKPERPAWQPPPFDKRFRGLVDYDEATGMYVGKSPNVPDQIVQAVNDYAAWYEQYTADPASILQPLMKQVATEVATEIYKTQMGQFGRDQAVSRITQSNASWAFQHDQAGNPMKNWDGTYVLTPQGQQYGKALEQVFAYGVTDPVHQDALAKQLIGFQGGAATAQQRQGNPAPAQHQPNRGSFASMNPAVAANNPGNPAPQEQPGLSLAQKMGQSFIKAGAASPEDFIKA